MGYDVIPKIFLFGCIRKTEPNVQKVSENLGFQKNDATLTVNLLVIRFNPFFQSSRKYQF